MMDQDKSVLQEKLSATKKEVSDVEAQIAKLESEIAALDPQVMSKNRMRLTTYRIIWVLSLPFLITAIILMFINGMKGSLHWVFLGIGFLLMIIEAFVCPKEFLKTCKEMNVNCTIFSSVYTKIQNAIDERQKKIDTLRQTQEELNLKIHEYEVRISLM